MFVRVAATALFLVLLAPAPAPATPRDRDRDGMPDRWEKRHRLSKPHADQDRDGLTNRAEYRLRTHPRRTDSDRDRLRDGDEVRFEWHPRRRDTDRDGIRDGDENAGVIVSVDGTRVVIRLARRGRLTGLVEDPQALGCATAPTVGSGDGTILDDDGNAGPDPADEDFFWDPDWGTRPTDLGDLDDDGDLARVAQADDAEEADGLEEDAEDPVCQTKLRPGALVREAETDLGRNGRRFTRLNLVG